MLGAIAGDVIGSVHEHTGTKTKQFPLFVPDSCFTDDSVLTIAVADAISSAGSYGERLRTWARRYPAAGYGSMFQKWMYLPDAPAYNSFGNGSAMRVSAVGWAFDDLESVLREARKTAEPSHDHPEGIRGAESVAGAVFLARTGHGKDEVREFLSGRFGYDCSATVDERRPDHDFDITCQGTVPAAAIAFLDSTDFEDAIRNAISLGGDADTLACIAGAIAEAFYGGVPGSIRGAILERLDLELVKPTLAFVEQFHVPVP